MLRLCAIRAPGASHAPRVDPVVEPGATRLLDLLRGHHLHGIDRHEVVAVLLGGDALGGGPPPDVIAAGAPPGGQPPPPHGPPRPRPLLPRGPFAPRPPACPLLR